MGAFFRKEMRYNFICSFHFGSILVPLVTFWFHSRSIFVPKQPKYTKNKPHKGNHKGGPAPKAPAPLCGGGRRPPPLWMGVWWLGGQQTWQKHASPAKNKQVRRKIGAQGPWAHGPTGPRTHMGPWGPRMYFYSLY